MADDEVGLYKMADDFNPPVTCGDDRCRDMFMELIYFVAIPGGVVIILMLVLSYYMCCSRTHRRKQTQSDQIQMEKYNSIRRASQSLRDLSRKRDTMLIPSRSGSMSFASDTERVRRTSRNMQESSYSASNTLQRDRRNIRQESPQAGASLPRYQMPPEYSSVAYLETESSRPQTLTVPAQHHRTPETQALMSGSDR